MSTEVFHCCCVSMFPQRPACGRVPLCVHLGHISAAKLTVVEISLLFETLTSGSDALQDTLQQQQILTQRGCLFP